MFIVVSLHRLCKNTTTKGMRETNMKQTLKSIFESKLTGRLAMLESVSHTSSEVSATMIARRYGKQIATLIEGGNKAAAKVVAISEEILSTIAKGDVDLCDLERLEDSVSEARRTAGVPNFDGCELVSLIRLATGSGYESRQHFQENLTEGLLVGVTTMASQALAIPPGQYAIMHTDTANTMLVPTSEAASDTDIVERSGSFDVHTDTLVANWNKIERLIGERKAFGGKGNQGDKRQPSRSRIGLPNLRVARKKAGLSLNDVADETGLGLSTVAKVELGHANPLHGTAEKIMGAIDCDPDVFYAPGEVTPNFSGEIDDTDDSED
jgi:DNA-binding XRE family transcriptional regulator